MATSRDHSASRSRFSESEPSVPREGDDFSYSPLDSALGIDDSDTRRTCVFCTVEARLQRGGQDLAQDRQTSTRNCPFRVRSEAPVGESRLSSGRAEARGACRIRSGRSRSTACRHRKGTSSTSRQLLDEVDMVACHTFATSQRDLDRLHGQRAYRRLGRGAGDLADPVPVGLSSSSRWWTAVQRPVTAFDRQGRPWPWTLVMKNRSSSRGPVWRGMRSPKFFPSVWVLGVAGYKVGTPYALGESLPAPPPRHRLFPLPAMFKQE